MDTAARTRDEPSHQELFIGEVAAALGYGWSWTSHPDHDGYGAFLDSPAKLRLVIVVGNPAARRTVDHDEVMIRLHLPDDLRPHVPETAPFPHIRVPASRTAASVANSIRKRVLPAAAAVDAGTRAVKSEHDQRSRHLTRTAEAMAALFGDGARISSSLTVAAGRGGDPVVAHASIGVGVDADRSLFSLEVPTAVAPLVGELIGRLRALYPTPTPTTAPGEAQNGFGL